MRSHNRDSNLADFKFPTENRNTRTTRTHRQTGIRETAISLRGPARKTRISDWEEPSLPTQINHITTNPNHRFLCAATNKGFLIFCLKTFKVLLERNTQRPLIECHMLNTTNLLFYRTKVERDTICVYDDNKQDEVDQIRNEPQVTNFQLNLRFLYVKIKDDRRNSIRVNVFDMATFKEKLYGVELTDAIDNAELVVCHNFPTHFYWSQKSKGVIKCLDVDQIPSKEKKLHSKYIPKFSISQSNQYLVTSSNNGTTFRVFKVSSYEKKYEFRWGSRFQSQIVSSMDIAQNDQMFLAVLEDGWVLVSTIDCSQKIEFKTNLENAQGIFLNHHNLVAVFTQKLELFLYQIDMDNKEYQLIFKNKFEEGF